jgi:hypothetical protein
VLYFSCVRLFLKVVFRFSRIVIIVEVFGVLRIYRVQTGHGAEFGALQILLKVHFPPPLRLDCGREEDIAIHDPLSPAYTPRPPCAQSPRCRRWQRPPDGTGLRHSRSPLFGNLRPDYRPGQRIGRGCLLATKVQLDRGTAGMKEVRLRHLGSSSLISSHRRQRDARW